MMQRLWLVATQASSKLMGILRTVVIAASFGTRLPAVAFIAASGTVGIVVTVLDSAVTSALIPVLAKVHYQEGISRTNELASEMVVYSGLLAVSVIGIVFASGRLGAVFVPGLPSRGMAEFLNDLRILSIVTVPAGINAVLTAYLQVKGQYWWQGSVGLAPSAGVICALALSSKGLYAAAWGNMAGWLVNAVIVASLAVREGFRFRYRRGRSLAGIAGSTTAAVVGSGTYQLGLVGDRIFSTLAGTSVLAELSYANNIVGSLGGLISMALATPIYGPITSAVVRNGTYPRRLAVKWLGIALMISGAVGIGTGYFASEIVEALYGRRRLGPGVSGAIAGVVGYMVGAVVGTSLSGVASRFVMAKSQMWLVSLTGGVGIASTVLIDALVWRPYGAVGIAIAGSVGSLVCGVGLGVVAICLGG